MEKTNLMLALVASYNHYRDLKDDGKKARIAAHIDKLLDEISPATKEEKKNEEKPDNLKEEKGKGKHVDKNTPNPKPHQQNNGENKEEKPKVEEKKEVDESIVEVAPFYACYVLAKNAKSPRRVSFTAPRTFKAYKTDADAKKGDNKYPTVEELELILDDAWNMACKAESNKKILEFCRTNLEKFYPELKGDTDWYSKLVNPLVGSAQMIKKSFGYDVKNANVSVTRPIEKDYTLKFDSDLTVTEPKKEEKPKVDDKPKGDEKKKELNTIKNGSGKKKEEIADEEVQETGKNKPVIDGEGNHEEEEENLELNLEDEDDDEEVVDTTNPPDVHKFDEFDEFETLIFTKMLETTKLAADKKLSEAEKKAIQAEGRTEQFNLIASNFEGQDWVKNVDDTWNPKIIKYRNALLTEIQQNKAKWYQK